MIRVVGDSHIMLFAGITDAKELVEPVGLLPTHNPNDKLMEFETYHVKLLRAYWIEKVIGLIKFLPQSAPIILSAGEIDCRGPILNIYHREKRFIKDIVKDCVDRYLLGVNHLRDQGWNIIMYSPVPNRFINEEVSPDYAIPEYLSPSLWCLLKQQAVIHFDGLIKESGMPVISLVDWIVDENISHDARYWWDTAHVNESVWPQLKLEFEKQGIELTLERRE